MRHFTDPTYLRTIHDGLLLGTIHKDNASNLPIGLIGIYEEALPSASNVNERKKFLEFFAVWALLKKEVSAAFVVPLLEGWTEEHVLDYISKYSKWFNCPVSGKYVLYHERVRAFILSKINNSILDLINTRLISNLYNSLVKTDKSEFEIYALEYFCEHIFNNSFKNKDERILEFASSDNFWNRQIEISNKFEWSKKSIYHCINFLNYKQDLRIADYYLLLIKLKHKEEDSIQLTIKLFNENKVNIAIDRLRNISYSGYSAQSRQFTGYILCLIESIRLNNGRFKINDTTSVKEILQDLEGITMDFDWFMPKGIVLMIYIESKRIGLNANFLFDKTYIDVNKFIESNAYNLDELFWIFELITGKIESYQKKYIISNFLKSVKSNYSQSLLDQLINLIEKDSSDINIKQIIGEINFKVVIVNSSLKQKTSKNVLDLNTTNETYIDYEQHIAYKIDEFIEKNTNENVIKELPTIIHYLSTFIHGLNSKTDKDEILNLIQEELIKNNEFEKAIKLSPEKSNSVLAKISKIIAKRDSLVAAFNFIEQINNQSIKDNTLLKIAQNYAEENRNNEAIHILKNLFDNIKDAPLTNKDFNYALNLAIELLKFNFKDEADILLQKSLISYNSILDSDMNYFKYEHRITFNKLTQFANNEIFVNHLKNNKPFKELYTKHLNSVKRNTPKYQYKKNETVFLNEDIMDIDKINSSARHLTLEKLKSLDIISGNRTQYLLLANRYMFSRDIGYVKDIDIRKHLFELRYELDELEIFYNIWALHSLFIDNNNERCEKWNKTLNLQWAIDIKKSLSEN